VQLEFTLECEIGPLRTYMGKVGSIVRLPWPIGQRETDLPSQIVCIDRDSEMRPPELHRVQHPNVGFFLCARVRAFDPSPRVGWREILSWYAVDGLWRR